MYRIFRPGGITGEVIECYWMVENFCNGNIHREWIYPQASLQMMFYFGGVFTRRGPLNDTFELSSGCVCGIEDSYSEVITPPGYGVLGVVFRPLAASRVFRFPLSEIRNGRITLEEWLGPAGKELRERVESAQEFSRRVAVLDNFFLGRISEPVADQRRIAGALKLIASAAGPVSLETLAETGCISERQFERIFKVHMGTTPKHFMRIARLNRAIELAGDRGSTILTHIAHAAGYYDQAHFNNEFKEMTGFSPGRFFRLECGAEPQED